MANAAAWQQPLFVLTFTAGADLSGKQFEVVKVTTAAEDKVYAVTSAGVLVGVLQNNPTSGMEASVMVSGVSKIKAGAATNKGTRLKVNVSATSLGGGFIAATSTIAGHNPAVGLMAATQGGDTISAIIDFRGGD